MNESDAEAERRSRDGSTRGLRQTWWTTQEVEQLLKYREQRLSVARIAEIMGCSTQRVEHKLQRLRDAPSRAFIGQIKTTERPCITCRRPFQSEGKHHRMCPNCTEYAADQGLDSFRILMK